MLRTIGGHSNRWFDFAGDFPCRNTIGGDMSEGIDKDQVIASLMESVENLRGELAQLRNNNRILRRVHSALRSANQSLQNRVAIAQQNDELFKELCQPDAYGVEAKDVEAHQPNDATV